MGFMAEKEKSAASESESEDNGTQAHRENLRARRRTSRAK
jgi:hypothetical protein